MAGHLALDLNGASYHMATKQHYNQRNPGMGFSYTWDKGNGWLIRGMLGNYLNSLKRNSDYAGLGIEKQWQLANGMHLGLGAMGGLITGYNGSAIPALLPSFTIGNDRFDLNTYLAPPVPGVTPATLMFSTSIPFE